MSIYTRRKTLRYQIFSCSTSSIESNNDSLTPFIRKSKEKEPEQEKKEEINGEASFYQIEKLPKRIKIEKNQYLSKTMDNDDTFIKKSNEFIKLIKNARNIVVYFDEEERTKPIQTTSKYEKEKLQEYKEFFEPYLFVKWKFRKNNNTKEDSKYCKLELVPKIAEKIIKLEENQIKPTFIHYALSKLVKNGIIKTIITNSTNNQLILAGVPKQNLIELYGNQTIKICKICRKEICKLECQSEFIINETKENEFIEEDVFEKIKETYNSDLCLLLDPKWLDYPFSHFSLKYPKTLICGIFTYGKGSIDLNMNQLFCFSNDFIIEFLKQENIKINQ